MKPSRFRAMPVDEFDYEVSVDSFDPEAKNGFIFGWGVCDVSTDEGVCFMRRDGDGIMVRPETVCEFTGFITRSGTPVYTNDIVKMFDKIAVVKKCKGSETQGNGMGGFYEYRLVNKNGLMLTRLNMPHIEVIGDVFNNSELLPNKDGER